MKETANEVQIGEWKGLLIPVTVESNINHSLLTINNLDLLVERLIARACFFPAEAMSALEAYVANERGKELGKKILVARKSISVQDEDPEKFAGNFYVTKPNQENKNIWYRIDVKKSPAEQSKDDSERNHFKHQLVQTITEFLRNSKECKVVIENDSKKTWYFYILVNNAPRLANLNSKKEKTKLTQKNNVYSSSSWLDDHNSENDSFLSTLDSISQSTDRSLTSDTYIPSIPLNTPKVVIQETVQAASPTEEFELEANCPVALIPVGHKINNNTFELFSLENLLINKEIFFPPKDVKILRDYVVKQKPISESSGSSSKIILVPRESRTATYPGTQIPKLNIYWLKQENGAETWKSIELGQRPGPNDKEATKEYAKEFSNAICKFIDTDSDERGLAKRPENFYILVYNIIRFDNLNYQQKEKLTKPTQSTDSSSTPLGGITTAPSSTNNASNSGSALLTQEINVKGWPGLLIPAGNATTNKPKATEEPTSGFDCFASLVDIFREKSVFFPSEAQEEAENFLMEQFFKDKKKVILVAKKSRSLKYDNSEEPVNALYFVTILNKPTWEGISLEQLPEGSLENFNTETYVQKNIYNALHNVIKKKAIALPNLYILVYNSPRSVNLNAKKELTQISNIFLTSNSKTFPFSTSITAPQTDNISNSASLLSSNTVTSSPSVSVNTTTVSSQTDDADKTEAKIAFPIDKVDINGYKGLVVLAAYRILNQNEEKKMEAEIKSFSTSSYPEDTFSEKLFFFTDKDKPSIEEYLRGQILDSSTRAILVAKKSNCENPPKFYKVVFDKDGKANWDNGKTLNLPSSEVLEDNGNKAYFRQEIDRVLFQFIKDDLAEKNSTEKDSMKYIKFFYILMNDTPRPLKLTSENEKQKKPESPDNTTNSVSFVSRSSSIPQNAGENLNGDNLEDSTYKFFRNYLKQRKKKRKCSDDKNIFPLPKSPVSTPSSSSQTTSEGVNSIDSDTPYGSLSFFQKMPTISRTYPHQSSQENSLPQQFPDIITNNFQQPTPISIDQSRLILPSEPLSTPSPINIKFFSIKNSKTAIPVLPLDTPLSINAEQLSTLNYSFMHPKSETNEEYTRKLKQLPSGTIIIRPSKVKGYVIVFLYPRKSNQEKIAHLARYDSYEQLLEALKARKIINQKQNINFEIRGCCLEEINTRQENKTKADTPITTEESCVFLTSNNLFSDSQLKPMPRAADNPNKDVSLSEVAWGILEQVAKEQVERKPVKKAIKALCGFIKKNIPDYNTTDNHSFPFLRVHEKLEKKKVKTFSFSFNVATENQADQLVGFLNKMTEDKAEAKKEKREVVYLNSNREWDVLFVWSALPSAWNGYSLLKTVSPQNILKATDDLLNNYSRKKVNEKMKKDENIYNKYIVGISKTSNTNKTDNTGKGEDEDNKLYFPFGSGTDEGYDALHKLKKNK